jgi:hypothetical protein
MALDTEGGLIDAAVFGVSEAQGQQMIGGDFTHHVMASLACQRLPFPEEIIY